MLGTFVASFFCLVPATTTLEIDGVLAPQSRRENSVHGLADREVARP
jgi:hypothetical protein